MYINRSVGILIKMLLKRKYINVSANNFLKQKFYEKVLYHNKCLKLNSVSFGINFLLEIRMIRTKVMIIFVHMTRTNFGFFE